MLCLVLCIGLFPPAWAEENVENGLYFLEIDDDYDAVESSDQGPAHEHAYTEVITLPTCTEQGYTTYTCECGESYVDNYTDSLGHKAADVPEVPATTESTGITAGKKCEVCGKILEGCEEIPKLKAEEPEEEKLRVAVAFQCEPAAELCRVTVMDKDGKIVEPISDEKTGKPVYGCFELAPGWYSYEYYDETGAFKNVEKTVFQVKAEDQSPVVITVKLEIDWVELTWINPVYGDEITKAELPEIIVPSYDLCKEKERNAVYVNTIGAFATDFRANLVNRASQFEIYYQTTDANTDVDSVFQEMIQEAFAHTGNSNEGDYLAFQIYGINAQVSRKTDNNITYFTIISAPAYFTTAAQENAVTNAASTLRSALDLSGKSDYQKIQLIHSWLVDNVTYGSTETGCSAYGALVEKQAAGYGFAAAFYMLCLEEGIDVRIVYSQAEQHAWNIARVDNAYYEIDTAWDNNAQSDTFFLRGSTYWLEEHHSFTNGGFPDLGSLASDSHDFLVSCASIYNISPTDCTSGKLNTRAAVKASAITVPVITTDPVSETAEDGSTVKFTVAADGGELSYQWQYQKKDSTTWVNSGAAGNRTTTLTVTAKYADSGIKYRCKVTNSKGTRASNAATLMVTEAVPTITTNPSSKTAANGSTVKFTVAASGGNLSYQWQYQKNNSTTWTDSGASGNRTTTLTVTAKYADSGIKYRCKVTNSKGTRASNAATLTLSDVPFITT
nr:immunoglobulin domain-containing protein [Clostridia bacterium]